MLDYDAVSKLEQLPRLVSEWISSRNERGLTVSGKDEVLRELNLWIADEYEGLNRRKSKCIHTSIGASSDKDTYKVVVRLSSDGMPGSTEYSMCVRVEGDRLEFDG